MGEGYAAQEENGGQHRHAGAEAGHQGGQDIRTLAGWKFAVIGPGTARALVKRGIFAAYMPEQYNVESLAAGLCEAARQDKEVLILRAEQGSPVLTEHLAAAGMAIRP